jgi:hypothetical protein
LFDSRACTNTADRAVRARQPHHRLARLQTARPATGAVLTTPTTTMRSFTCCVRRISLWRARAISTITSIGCSRSSGALCVHVLLVCACVVRVSYMLCWKHMNRLEQVRGGAVSRRRDAHAAAHAGARRRAVHRALAAGARLVCGVVVRAIAACAHVPMTARRHRRRRRPRAADTARQREGTRVCVVSILEPVSIFGRPINPH